ncbi:granzyme B-like [Salminus brasiliensis]|uniref:granzyme B-like n=1 Tax=Salminus brasiliensis TaxID=930266 RepID=UPI003B836D8A
MSFLPLLVLSVFTLSGAMESGIIGGKKAKPHSRPYMVSLQLYKKHMCGGMLIRKDYVLTSAHCIDNVKQSAWKQLEVVLGAHNLNKKEFGRQRIQVQKCIRHPSYIQNEMHHDIMLLKLKNNASLNKFTRVLELPQKNKKLPANQMCSIAGWGLTASNGSLSDVLQEVNLKLQFDFECKNMWKNFFDSEQMICTASDGKRAFCQGDSGGPLICNNKPQGLATYTYLGNCIKRKYPEVYIKIGYFLPWIKKTIG